jgi:SAM-dependent methyltransferase
MPHVGSAAHWDDVYGSKPHDQVSWWQPDDEVWVDLITDAGIPLDAHIIDVGSGASTLVDALLGHGYQDLTLVDLSAAALHKVRERLEAEDAARAKHVRYMIGDVRGINVGHPVRVWFDRAVFHFFTDPEDRAAYILAMRGALEQGGLAIVSTYAPDGPTTCSGLPVENYDVGDLVAALDAKSWRLVRSERRLHTTPQGDEQPFTVVVLERPEHH